MADELETVAYWQGILEEVESELKEMGGAPDLSMGPLTVDEDKAFDRLQRRKVEAVQNIRRLGGSSNIALSFSSQAGGNY